MAGRCVYTVVTNGYEQLLEQPIARHSDVDLLCFTDNPDLRSDTWQIRLFEPHLPQDPYRSSRRPKILAHEYLPDHDVSLYIDNTVLLLADPNEIIDKYLAQDRIAMFRHSVRDTVRDEFETVVASGADAPWVCHEQLSHYDISDPSSLDEPPWWVAMVLRRHHDPQVISAMQVWWEHVLRYSRRDQLSAVTALRQAGVEVVTHRVDNFHSDHHEWPRQAFRTPRPAPAPGPESLIAELRDQLQRAQDEVGRLQEQQAELAETVRMRDGALVTAATAAAGTQAQAAALRQQLAQLRSSNSWRLTAPLRRLRPRRWFRR